MSTGYDYTRTTASQDIPEESPDEFMLGGEVANVSDRSADRIAAENGWRDVPPGRHVLLVSGFRGAPDRDYYHCTVGGKASGYNAHRVRVRFCLPSDPRATVEDTFLLPPEDPRELDAYFNGIEGENQAPGFQANKFVHFIDRLGFPFPPGGKLPEAARRLGNWKGRPIVATVQPGKPFKGRDGVEKSFPQVKLFSYEYAPPGGRLPQGNGAAAPVGAGSAQRAGGGPSGGNRRPSNLDDV